MGRGVFLKGLHGVVGLPCIFCLPPQGGSVPPPLSYRLQALNIGGLQLGLQTRQVEKSISLRYELTSLGYFVRAAHTDPDPITTAAHTEADDLPPWLVFRVLAGCVFVCWF